MQNINFNGTLLLPRRKKGRFNFHETALKTCCVVATALKTGLGKICWRLIVLKPAPKIRTIHIFLPLVNAASILRTHEGQGGVFVAEPLAPCQAIREYNRRWLTRETLT